MRFTGELRAGSAVHRAPWLQIAAEARWRVLRHLEREQRPPIRAMLAEHVRQLERVIRAKRAA